MKLIRRVCVVGISTHHRRFRVLVVHCQRAALHTPSLLTFDFFIEFKLFLGFTSVHVFVRQRCSRGLHAMGASGSIYSYRGADVNTYYLEEIEPDIRGLLKKCVLMQGAPSYLTAAVAARRCVHALSHTHPTRPCHLSSSPPIQAGNHRHGWNGAVQSFHSARSGRLG